MWPIGDFGLLRESIMDRYHDYEHITFGILLADPRQADSREYILNYLDVFHTESGRCFDFFLPGYDEYFHGLSFDVKCNIRIGDKKYHFDERMFNEFCFQLDKELGIQYTFNPMLILMSIKPGYMQTAEYIVIELDDNEYHNARRSGILFRQLFKIVKNNPELQHIRTAFGMSELKGNVLSILIDEIAPNWLSQIVTKGKELRRYKIHHIG